MPGNSLAYHKANQTKIILQELDDIRELEEQKLRREVINNQLIWSLTNGLLSELDLDYDEWFNSPIVPERIPWIGNDFQNVLKILWDRIYEVRSKQ